MDIIEDGAMTAMRNAMTRRQMLGLGTTGLAAAVLAACGSSSTKADAPATTKAGETATTKAPETVTTKAGETATTKAETAPAGGGKNAAKFGGGGKDGKIKIGFTAPLTGPLAGFGAANDFTLKAVGALTKDGIQLGGKSYAVEIITKDTQSNSDTAAKEALKLINDDKVDMMIAIATPEMINPVADQCEANGVPCLSTLAPWQPYFFGRKGDPAKGFDWTYHFFWGAGQMVGNFVDMWESIPGITKTVALFAPNDPDGNALADEKLGFPGGAVAAGYKVIDGGRYNTGTQDFSTMIGQFKGADAVVGIPIPPDFATFWKQARQQGFKPKIATIAKGLLFPEAVEALGDDGDGICTEIWWTPSHPYKSSLTGASCKDLGDEFSKVTGKQWTQFVGFVHALMEVTLDSIARAGSTDKKKLVDAIAATKLDTMVGPISFNQAELPKNVCPTPLVGGQWQKTAGGPNKFELVITNNKQATNIPIGGKLKPLA
jgi:branched-chain amino acid transport system substrate-binding protein